MRNPLEQQNCGAVTRAGGRCKRPAGESGQCRLHGEAPPATAVRPRPRQGGLSKYLVGERRTRFVAAAGNPELLSLQEDIVLATLRQTELVERLTTGESRERWQALKNTMRALRRAEKRANKAAEQQANKAVEQGDDTETHAEAAEERAQAIDTMERLVDEALGDDQAWQALEAQSLHKAKLVGEERRRLVDLQQMMTMEQAHTRDAAIFAIITRYVRDQEMLEWIGAEFRAVALGQPG